MAEYESYLTPVPDDTDEARTHRDKDGVVKWSASGTIEVEQGEGIEEEREPGGHHENLAEHMDTSERRKLAQELCDVVSADLDSRKDWEGRIKEGLQILGMEDVPDDEAPFEGASQVNIPVLMEACVQFQARAMKEVFPVTGPVKTAIVGKSDEEKRAAAERQKHYMNYHLLHKDKGWRQDTDQLTMRLPMEGSAFKKVFQDPVTNECISRLVKVTDFIAPYDANSLEDAPRYTHRYRLTGNEIRRAQDLGNFIKDVDLQPPNPEDSVDDIDAHEKSASDQLEKSYHDDDEIFNIYEVHVEQDLDADPTDKDFALPYVITVDVDNEEILAIRRNWRKSDEQCRKRVWFAHYRYLPGLGFYGFGLLHIIGSLGKAASGAVRALLDSAAMASLQGGFKAKTAGKIGEVQLSPGVWKDVDMDAEELAKSFYTPPFKEPSRALFQLLELLINSARQFASITEAMTGDASNTGPVGTTVALIEQSMQVFSGIHTRMHSAAKEEYETLAALIYEFGEESYPYTIEGESGEVMRADFDPESVDVLPVSDPNITSTTQKIALAQSLFEMVNNDQRGVYDEIAVRAAHRYMLDAMGVPADIKDEVLPEETAHRQDPVSENQSLLYGKQVKAFPSQDHRAHIEVHNEFMNMLAKSDPTTAKQLAGVMKAHIAEHIGWLYRQEVDAQMMASNMPVLPEFSPEERTDPTEELPPEIERDLSQRIAAAHKQIKLPGSEKDPEADKSPEQIEAEREQQRKDAEHKAEMKRREEKHQQDRKHEEEKHRQKIRHEREEHAMDLRKELSDDQREQQRQAREEREQGRGVVKKLLGRGKKKGEDNGEED